VGVSEAEDVEASNEYDVDFGHGSVYMDGPRDAMQHP